MQNVSTRIKKVMTPEERKESARLAHIRFVQKHGFASDAEYQKALRQRYKKQVFELLGGVCVRCGFSDMRALQIDHIAGNGKTDPHNRGNKNDPAYYNKILKVGGIGYQILCANCNWIKRYENNE